MKKWPLLLLALLNCSKTNNVSIDDGADSGAQLAPPANTAPSMPDCSVGTPPQTKGGPMVHVGLLGGNCFWIDQTEVPRSDYKTFLAAADTARYVGPGCEADSTHSTTACEQTNANSSAKITLADDHPIVCVDWCDAWAYCEWAGKTLCQGNWTKEADPTVSMFYSACSDGGQNPYPTGKNLDAQACNGAKNPVTGCESGSCTTAAVGTTACRTPEGAFDLAGNVREWTAECSGTSATSECRARGGSMIDVDLTCSSQGTSYRKQIGYPTVGFRCCASAP